MGVQEINSCCLKKCQLVPPDGGWGYLIAVSTIINFTIIAGFIGCFGMMYNEFIYETKMSSAGITLLTGINCLCMALSGLFTNPLLAIMSKRKLAFVGAVIFNMGAFGVVIMTTPLLFYISYGILQGAGTGILFNLTFTIMNEYFLHKKVLIMNFVQTAVGFFTMVAPIFVKWSLDKYGSRGTLLLIGGISLHSFLSVLLMQPVEWHMKKVAVSENPELKQLLTDFEEIKLEEQVKETNPSVVNLTDLKINLEKCDASAETTYDSSKENVKKSSFRKVLEKIIDPSVCKTFLFSCACLGPSICGLGDTMQAALVPQYLYSKDWSQENVATAIALYGFGDLSMRVVFTFVSNWMMKLGVQTINIIGIAVAVLARLGMLWSSNMTSLMVYFTLMGMAHCSIVVLGPLVITDTVPTEKFTSAMGISICLSGLFGICLGSAIGAVQDYTNSNAAAFYIFTSFYLLIVLIWPIELIIKKNKQRKITKSISVSSQLNKIL